MNGSAPLPELLETIAERDAGTDAQTRTVELAPLMARTDGHEIFEEGRRFAGSERRGRAEAVLTVVPSPHVTARVRSVDLCDALDGYIDGDVTLPPGMEDLEHVSPQLLVWWRDAIGTQEGRMDVLRLTTQPRYAQRCFAEVIGRQVAKAHRSIKVVTGQQPVVWGSWGHATVDERLASGRNRGVPTNEHGHMHVMAFDELHEKSGVWGPAHIDARLNAYRPWTLLLHRRHGESVARYIQERNACVKPFERTIVADDDRIAGVNAGYAVRFDEPLRFSDAYIELLDIAGSLEMAYRRLDDSHRQFHVTPAGSAERARIYRELIDDVSMMGLPATEASKFVDFVLAIKPTYSQLLSWLDEADGDSESIAHLQQQVRRYERLRRSLAVRRQDGKGAMSAILSATLAEASERPPSSVLNEHLAATYIWNVAGESKGELLMTGFDLYVSLDSTESAPEILTGRSLRRSTGA